MRLHKRHLVSLSEFSSTRTRALHRACNIPIRMAGNQASMIDLQGPALASANGGLADPILTAVHDDCLTGYKGGIVAC